MSENSFPLHDPFFQTAVYVDGIATVHYIGPNAHVVLSVAQPNTYDGKIQRLVAARLVIPRCKLVEIGQALASGQERRLDYEDDVAPAGIHPVN